MKSISSRQNPLFKRIFAAIREHDHEIVIEGPKPVADAIACGWKPIAVITRGVGGVIPSPVNSARRAGEETMNGGERALLPVPSPRAGPAAGQAGLPVPHQFTGNPGVILSDSEGPSPDDAPQEPGEVLRFAQDDRVAFAPELFDALAETNSPQNVIGLFERPRASAVEILSRRDTVAIALDGVQDPGNVGTIVRLAAAFDAAGVLLLPGCADPFGGKAIRSSVGAILNVPVADITIRELLDARVNLVAADMSGAATDPPSRDAVFVFGNEGSGVSRELMQAAMTLAIPMSARVESLNVASSAAILLARSFSLR